MCRPFEREIAAALAVGCKQDANIYLVNFVVFLGGAFWRLSGFDHLCVILAKHFIVRLTFRCALEQLKILINIIFLQRLMHS